MGLITVSLGLLLVALFLRDSNQFGLNMGPYIIVVEQITNCPTTGERNINVEVHPYFVKHERGRKQLFTFDGYFPFNKEEFEALNIHLRTFLRKNNNYLLMYKFEDNFCDAIALIKTDDFKIVRGKMGLEIDTCAIKPGNYSFRDWNPVPSLPTPMLEYGTYKTFMEVLLEDKIVWCIEVVCVVKRK